MTIRFDLCIYCGDWAEENEHVVPRSQGGTLTMPSCRPCNREKGTRSVAQWFADCLLFDERKFSDEKYDRWLRRRERTRLLIQAVVLDAAELHEILERRREELLVSMQACLDAADALDGWVRDLPMQVSPA